MGKLYDIPEIRGIFATRTEYQSGVKKKAKDNNIDLLIVREQNDSDWADEYGNPLIKIIHFDIISHSPASIYSFQPVCDQNLIQENTNIDITKPFPIRGLNNEIFIENIEKMKCFQCMDCKTNCQRWKIIFQVIMSEYSNIIMLFKNFVVLEPKFLTIK